MARLIVKSGYIKPGGSKGGGGSKGAGGYLSYIGTRERVEILPDARPPTRKQEQLIQKLVTDFPSMKESEAYEKFFDEPTKYHASQFITQALEENWSEVLPSRATPSTLPTVLSPSASATTVSSVRRTM